MLWYLLHRRGLHSPYAHSAIMPRKGANKLLLSSRALATLTAPVTWSRWALAAGWSL